MKKMMFNCMIVLIGAMFTIFLGSFKLLNCYDVATYSNSINCLFYLSIAMMAAGFILCLNELYYNDTKKTDEKKTTK